MAAATAIEPIAYGKCMILPPAKICASSLQRLIEISQVRRLLALLDGHQMAVRTQQVVFLADGDVVIAFDTIVFRPDDLLLTTVIPRDRPRTCQCVVNGGHLVVKNARI